MWQRTELPLYPALDISKHCGQPLALYNCQSDRVSLLNGDEDRDQKLDRDKHTVERESGLGIDSLS